MMCMSSTPWSPSISSTMSRIVSRMSGRFIGGSGNDTSSTAMVTFIPGVRSACSGSMSSGWCSA